MPNLAALTGSIAAVLAVAGCGLIDSGPQLPYSCTAAADGGVKSIEAALRQAGVGRDSLAIYGDCNSYSPRLVNADAADKPTAERLLRQSFNCGAKKVVVPKLPDDVSEQDRADLEDTLTPFWQMHCEIASLPTEVEIFDDDENPGLTAVTVELLAPSR